LRVLRCGSLFHDFVQQFLPKDTIEQVIETDDVYCRADHVSIDTVYDIKSQHSKAFWYMEKANYDIKKEKYNNWLQVMWAAVQLKKEFGSLIFVSKDDLCIAEYKDYTKNWTDEVMKEEKALKAAWLSKDAPKPEPRAYNGKDCDYCNWRTLCKEETTKATTPTPAGTE
jgi:hypothetical protein